MRTLVIGGSGMIGHHIVKHLRSEGHEVTIGVNRGNDEVTKLGLPILQGDYTDDGFTEAELAGFDTVVFAAGMDVRHLKRDMDANEFWQRYQIDGVPELAKRARAAGVECFVQIGSYYHMIQPELAETVPYVNARQQADERTRALATDAFRAITLNPPSIVGVAPGSSAHRFQTLVGWAEGKRPEFPATAPPGATNYMSVRSLAQAVSGAIARGEAGRAYLVGDENLSYREYLQLLVDASGGSAHIVVVDENHAFLPDRMLVHGRSGTISFEPPAEDVALLGYDRGDVTRAMNELVETVRTQAAEAETA